MTGSCTIWVPEEAGEYAEEEEVRPTAVVPPPVAAIGVRVVQHGAVVGQGTRPVRSSQEFLNNGAKSVAGKIRFLLLCCAEKQCASSCRRGSNLSHRFSAQQSTDLEVFVDTTVR